jgi:DNA-directed RNA polymerase specialized sigma24 family protein
MCQHVKSVIPGKSGQRDPPSVSLLFYLLYAQFASFVRCRLRNLPLDDREDVEADVWLKVWRDLKARKFEYMGEKEAKRWLTRKLEWTNADYWRNRLSERPLLSLSSEVELDDGTVELIEIIPAVCADDPTDDNMRQLVLEIAGQRLRNPDQLELVKRRILGQPLPTKWSESWINTNWHRVVKELLEAFRTKSQVEPMMNPSSRLVRY